jgi:hypothetical protein
MPLRLLFIQNLGAVLKYQRMSSEYGVFGEADPLLDVQLEAIVLGLRPRSIVIDKRRLETIFPGVSLDGGLPIVIF